MPRSKPKHTADVERLRRLSEHWRARALEFLAMARGADRSMYLRSAETANRLAAHFERELARIDRR